MDGREESLASSTFDTFCHLNGRIFLQETCFCHASLHSYHWLPGIARTTLASQMHAELVEFRFDQKQPVGFQTMESRDPCRFPTSDWTAPMKAYLEKVLQLKQRGWRRRHDRYRADFPLKASVLREEGYIEIQGRCADIGHGGMGTVLTAEVEKGEVLSLEFHLPFSTESFLVRAIVRYRRGFVHGLEFLGLSEEQQATIDAFCDGLVPMA